MKYPPLAEQKPTLWHLARPFNVGGITGTTYGYTDPTPEQLAENKEWVRQQIDRIGHSLHETGQFQMPDELCMTLEEYIDAEMTSDGHKSLFPGGKMLEDTDTRE